MGLEGLQELLGKGYRLVKWDGMYVAHSHSFVLTIDVISSTPTLIVDDNDRVIAVLVGRPINDPTWDSATESAARAIDSARQRAMATFKDSEKVHCRGSFPYFNTGVSYGQGQTVWGFLYCVWAHSHPPTDPR
jgi:hypothetical protein